jgi:hypothetical protein
MVVEFCSNIVDKIKSFQTSLSSPAVLPFAKIYYPIEDDQPFHEEYKIDSTKLCLLRLAFTQAKLAWSIGSVNPLKFIDLYKEGSQIAITSIMEALGIQKRTIGIPKEYLLRIADHLSSDAQSPALADGCLDYNQYALVADMLGFILSHPEMTDLAIKLQVVPESMLQIREGLVQGCRTLLLTYLNVCEDCFFKLYTCNVYFEKHSQGSGVVVPCPHGFVLSHI